MRPALITSLRRGRAGDGLGQRPGLDHDEVGRAADGDAVAGDTQHVGGRAGHHVEGQRQFLVVPEIGAVADHHGAFEHVAVAERRPGIADIVGAAEHANTVVAQELQRRDGGAARTVAHDRNAGLGQEVGRALGQVGRHRAQRKGVAHRDLALQAGRPGALGDRTDLGQAAFAAVVQMDVDADAAALGDGEDRIEMAVEVAVDADRVEAAQKVGALGDGGVEQRRGARRAQDAALREGHDLDGDEVAEALAHLQDLVEVPEARAGCRCRRGCACAACRWPPPGARDWRRSPIPERSAPRAPCARPRCGRRRGCRRPGWAPRAGRAASCRDGCGRRPAAAGPGRRRDRAHRLLPACPRPGGGRRSALPRPRCRACCRRAAWRWRAARLYLSAMAPASLRVCATAVRAAMAIRPESLAMVTKWKPMPIARAA